MYSQTSEALLTCSLAKGCVWENSLTKEVGREIFYGITHCSLVTKLSLLECASVLENLSAFNMKPEAWQLS